MTLEAKLKLDNKTPQAMPLSRSPLFSFLFSLWMMSSCWGLFPPTDENSSWLSVMGWIVPPNSCPPRTYVAKSLQLCLTLCDPIDSSPPGSAVPGILQARTLEWVAISFSNAWKWKVKVKSLSRVRLLATPWPAAYQALPSTGFSRQEYWSGLPLSSPPETMSMLLFGIGFCRYNQAKMRSYWVRVCESDSVVSDFFDPIDYTVHGLLQARMLEWIALLSSRGSSQLRDRTQISHIAGGFFTSWATKEALLNAMTRVYKKREFFLLKILIFFK